MTRRIKKHKRKLIDIWHYLLGNYRYKLYYSKYFKWLIRVHIRGQIKYRIVWMDQDCYEQGSCKKCGCETTALQMCNKSCDKPCYPPMMNEHKWKIYNFYKSVVKIKEVYWYEGIFGEPKQLKN